jgi:LysM repeat protein
MGLLESFVHEAAVVTDYVGPATFELSGDDPRGVRDAGLDTQSVSIIVIGGMQGYQLHQVVRGDTVSAIARATGSTVAKIAAASRLRDPNKIQVGQVLRVPL